ncbi:MAG: hypothetical protein MZV65_41450 [Chromatiales bacterium]|nr:hypothetical protein [Chromatiales bacterium]
MGYDLVSPPVTIQTGGGRRQHPHQRLGNLPGPVAGGHFQKPAGQQEEDEHRHRVVVDLAAASPRCTRRWRRRPAQIASDTGTSMPSCRAAADRARRR